MTNKEQLELLTQYKSTGNIELRNQLITENLGLVQKLSEKMGLTKNYDEILSYATVEMIKAIDNFDIARGTKLSTVLWHYVKTAIRLYLRDRESAKIKDAPLFEENHETMRDDPFETLAKQEDNDYLKSVLSQLSTIQQDIVSSFFGFKGKKQTLQEIGIRLGINKHQVFLQKKEALEKIRDIF